MKKSTVLVLLGASLLVIFMFFVGVTALVYFKFVRGAAPKAGVEKPRSEASRLRADASAPRLERLRADASTPRLERPLVSRSDAYGVSMAFPPGWKIEEGRQPGVVWAASHGRASMRVTARDGENGGNDLDFRRLSEDELKTLASTAVDMVKESYPEARADKVTFATWAGQPAFVLRYQGRFGREYDCTTLRVETIRDGRHYAVTVVAPEADYDGLTGALAEAIGSFAIGS